MKYISSGMIFNLVYINSYVGKMCIYKFGCQKNIITGIILIPGDKKVLISGI